MSAAKVWVDVLTPKQVLFFHPVIDILEKIGLRVLATSRHYREVEPLAKMRGLELEYVGERGGKDRLSQLEASLERQRMLLPIVEEFAPDLSVSVASVECARISFGLGIKHVAVNDSPHSTVAGKLALPLSYHLLTPWVIPYSVWSIFGLGRGVISRYRALDPAAWLKRPYDGNLDLTLDRSRKTIVVRLEESYAPYMRGTSESWGETVLLRLAEDFKGCNLVALCRYEDQLESIKKRHGDTYLIPDHAIDGTALLKMTDVFVGMGGTMNAEAALSGTPTISAFQGDLYTERYLSSKRLLVRSRDAKMISRFVKRFLVSGYRAEFSKKAKKLLDSMEDPVPRIARSIEMTAGQA